MNNKSQETQFTLNILFHLENRTVIPSILKSDCSKGMEPLRF